MMKIYFQEFPTVLGPMYAAATDVGLCLLEFTDRRLLAAECADLKQRLWGKFINSSNEYIDRIKKEIGEYFDKKRSAFSVPLHTPGTDFQQSVWKILEIIAFGETVSYQGLARLFGNDKAVRAVASAIGRNRVAIVIPCHRVIGKDGNLVGYAAGLQRKRWLLDHEAGKNPVYGGKKS